jgi:hypothetical protein
MIVEVFLKLGEVRPMWHITMEDGRAAIFEHPLIDDKNLAMIMVKEMFEKEGVVEAVFVSEAWAATLPAKTTSEAEIEHWSRVGIVNHPDRREVIVYQAEDSQTSCSAHREITRDEEGGGHLGPLIVDDYKISEGRMIGFLPRRGTVQ